MIATLLLAASVAAVPSTSKLGVRVVGADDTGLLAASPCPRVAVFPLDANAIAGAQVAAFKSVCPGGIAVARVGTDGLPVNAPVADQLVPVWLQTVPPSTDAVEGPQVTGLPAEVAAFWSRFAELVQAARKIPVLAVAATSPCPAATGTFWWSWRARSPMTQGPDDVATTLGYRTFAHDCTLAGLPLVLTDVAPA